MKSNLFLRIALVGFIILTFVNQYNNYRLLELNTKLIEENKRLGGAITQSDPSADDSDLLNDSTLFRDGRTK